MIPQAYINEWQQFAPWPLRSQVEQDLIICRALVETFNHPFLTDKLAFRGGTALFKLHLAPARYSEDIDLVQVQAGPIGPIMDALQESINPWLGTPKRKQSEGRITLTYRVESEEGIPLKLKMEINSREHVAVLGLERKGFTVESRWFTGSTSILTYNLDEMLGTKLRALYQRKKGRDLFDIWKACTTVTTNPENIVHCFLRYIENENHRVSRAEFEQNLNEKMEDPLFTEDIGPLLMVEDEWNIGKAAEYVMDELVALIPGEPWKGSL